MKKVNGRGKGARGERQVAKEFASWWGSDFARTPMSGGFHTRKFRQEWNAEGDLVTPDESFPFSIECKWHEGWTLDKLITASDKCEIWSWWQQALDQAENINKIPMLVFKRNNMPWYYMMCTKDVLSKIRMTSLPGKTILAKDHREKEVVIGLLSDLHSTKKDLWK